MLGQFKTNRNKYKHDNQQAIRTTYNLFDVYHHPRTHPDTVKGVVVLTQGNLVICARRVVYPSLFRADTGCNGFKVITTKKREARFNDQPKKPRQHNFKENKETTRKREREGGGEDRKGGRRKVDKFFFFDFFPIYFITVYYAAARKCM